MTKICKIYCKYIYYRCNFDQVSKSVFILTSFHLDKKSINYSSDINNFWVEIFTTIIIIINFLVVHLQCMLHHFIAFTLPFNTFLIRYSSTFLFYFILFLKHDIITWMIITHIYNNNNNNIGDGYARNQKKLCAFLLNKLIDLI